MLTMKSIKPLQKYLMGAAALLGLVCPASAEPSATASGTEMVTPASYQALTRYRSYFTELPATDTAPMGFRVTSPERLDPIWRVGAFMSTTGDIAKGDLLVLSMQIRGAGSRPDSAKILFKLQVSSWVGVIREDLDPGTIAHEYEEAGAVAVSVLTENQFFDGSVDDLQAAREATRIPILRKDFIIDPYQVPRSYGTGADAILVIVRAVPDDTTLHQILDAAENIHLDVLTEVYDEQDCERLLEIGKDSPNGLRVVGFNCRDLTTFQTDLTRPAKLVPYFPETTTLISLSGVKTRADIEAVRASSPRLTRFLIGESLLRAEYPGDALRALLDPKS